MWGLRGRERGALVAIAEAAVFLLAGSVPDVEPERTEVGVEIHRMDLHSHGGCRGRGQARWVRAGCAPPTVLNSYGTALTKKHAKHSPG